MVCRGRVLGKGRLGAVTGFGGGGIGALDEKRRRLLTPETPIRKAFPDNPSAVVKRSKRTYTVPEAWRGLAPPGHTEVTFESVYAESYALGGHLPGYGHCVQPV